jgi:hypothetical protein
MKHGRGLTYYVMSVTFYEDMEVKHEY